MRQADPTPVAIEMNHGKIVFNEYRVDVSHMTFRGAHGLLVELMKRSGDSGRRVTA